MSAHFPQGKWNFRRGSPIDEFGLRERALRLLRDEADAKAYELAGDPNGIFAAASDEGVRLPTRERRRWLISNSPIEEATQESDWDFLVVVPESTPDSEFDPMVAWQLRKDEAVPVDLVLTPKSEFEEYQSVTCTIQYEAAHFGVLVFGR